MTTKFRSQLLDSGLLFRTAVDGLYGLSDTFEKVVRGVDELVTAAGADQRAPVIHFPAVTSRLALERSGYPRSFPDLLGTIRVFEGDDALHAKLLEQLDSGENWTELLTTSDMALSAAACQPLYPACSGRVPAGGRRYEIFGHCFRREPSLDPVRMQAFRQHEFVYMGDPAGAIAHRDAWLARFVDLFAGLGLDVEASVANDPFFGRMGRMLASNQRCEALKYEIACTVDPDAPPSAISSSNYHRDHFARACGIQSADGDVAHTACSGFGVERTTLALLGRHGLNPDKWPSGVLSRLWP
jgi:seryl-tRNA synthetase